MQMRLHSGTNTYDTSSKQRVPSWTDRVLVTHEPNTPVAHIHYRRYETDISDHKVSASSRYSGT